MKKKGTTQEYENIRSILAAEEARLRKILKEDAGDIKELQSEWQERDSPAERNLRAVEWDQFSSLQEELSEIMAAMERLDKGIYGVCEECEEMIPAGRLNAVPSARKCVPCQTAAERNMPRKSTL